MSVDCAPPRSSKDTGRIYYRDTGLPERMNSGEPDAMGQPQAHQDAKQPIILSWEENDPDNPKNWALNRRWYLTALSSFLTLNSTFASAAPVGIVPKLVEEFHVSREAGILVLSLFVAGFAVGPLIWHPMSERFGRRPILLGTSAMATIFQMATALSTDMKSILACRVLAGIFAAGPLANSGAVIGDVWEPSNRGKALSLFTLAPFAGPSLGPAVSGFLDVAGVHWSWIFWILSITSGICLVLVVFTLPETHGHVLLAKKARYLRGVTGNDQYVAPLEVDRKTFFKHTDHAIFKPFRITFSEPLLTAITIHMSFLYGCFYLLFEAYPKVFEGLHDLNPGEAGLMLLNLPIGGALGAIVHAYYANPKYQELVRRLAPNPVPPEARLEMALVGTPLFAIACFAFGWSSFSSVPFQAPFVSGILMGLAIYSIFLSLVNYVADTYFHVAVSTLAANSVCQSLAGALFPLFTPEMYEKLKPQWAFTLLGCLALAMTPIPFVLLKYGPQLRAGSQHASADPSGLPNARDPDGSAAAPGGGASTVGAGPQVGVNALGNANVVTSDSDGSFIHIPIARTSSQIFPSEALDIKLSSMQGLTK